MLMLLQGVVKSMSDGFSVNIDKIGVLVLSGIYKHLLDGCNNDFCSVDRYYELHGFERALRLVGIDPEFLKGVDTSL